VKNITKLLFSAFASRKFLMTLFGLAALWLVYWKQVDYLYSFIGQSPEIVAAYVSITRDFMLAFTAAVLAYLGVNGVVAWKHNTESVLTQVAQGITEKREEHIVTESTQRIIADAAERFRDDPSYAPIQPDTTETFR
jgi:hypothetical protein